MTSLQDVAIRDMFCQTEQEKHLLHQLMLVSRIANTLRPKDLPGIKRRSRTTASCHICDVKKHEPSSCTLSSRRNLLNKKSLIASLSCSMKRSVAEDTLPELLLLLILSVFHAFHLIGLHPSVYF